MSFAGLMFCEVNLRVPKDNAVASVDDVEEEYPLADEAGDTPAEGREEGAFLAGWRLSCKALAKALSWVRTKLARF